MHYLKGGINILDDVNVRLGICEMVPEEMFKGN